MVREASKQSGKLIAAAIALAVALAAALLAAPAAQAQADEGAGDLTVSSLATQDDAPEYFISFKGAPYSGDYGLYGVPGEKMTLKASVKYYDPDNDWELTTVKGATFKWTNVNSKLKAVTKGNTILIKKLPKAGSYKFRLTAYNKSGKKIFAKYYKIVVKKAPQVTIKMRVRGDQGFGTKNNKWAYQSDEVMLDLSGATWGWDNNTKKPFYVWKITDTDTGEVAVWNSKKGMFKSNNIINLGVVAGGANPTLLGGFQKTGNFEIKAAVYHSNKKITTATKNVTIY